MRGFLIRIVILDCDSDSDADCDFADSDCDFGNIRFGSLFKWTFKYV